MQKRKIASGFQVQALGPTGYSDWRIFDRYFAAGYKRDRLSSFMICLRTQWMGQHNKTGRVSSDVVKKTRRLSCRVIQDGRDGRFMKRAFLMVVFIVFCAAGRAQTSAVGNMLGAWKLDPARSTYSLGLPPKSLLNTIEAVDGGLKVVSYGIDAKGKPTHFEWTAKFDGKDYPVKGDPTRDAISIKNLDNYTLELTNKKDGKVVNVVHAVYAKDGRSRTETRTGTDALGRHIENVTYWVRQ